MRRPARVKPFLVVRFLKPTADQREAHLTFSLSFLGKVFLRLSILPMADQREAHNAAIPNTQIADSPYFHPHSFMERSLRCQLGVLNLDRVLPSRTRTDALPSEGRPSPTPQSPELGGLV